MFPQIWRINDPYIRPHKLCADSDASEHFGLEIQSPLHAMTERRTQRCIVQRDLHDITVKVGERGQTDQTATEMLSNSASGTMTSNQGGEWNW